MTRALLAVLAACLLASSCAKRDVWKDLPARPATAPGPGEVSLALVGDVMLSRNVAKRVRKDGVSWSSLVEQAAPYLADADIAAANLETPISGRGERVAKGYTFNAPPESVQALVAAGFDVVSLANNHTLDYGPTALEDTTRALDAAGIRWGGIVAGDAPQEPVVVEKNGVRVGFLFYCEPSRLSCAPEFDAFAKRPAKATEQALARDLAALRPRVDVVVVSIHWGTEYRAEPDAHVVDLARRIVDLGADVVAGHHPHVQQRVERRGRGVILYSMGNFLFDQRSRDDKRAGRIYRLIVGGQGVRDVAFVPLEIVLGKWTPVPLTSGFVDVERDSAALRERVPHPHAPK